jgi:hypothetical protein
MARRSGKAANRRSRQRPAHRAASRLAPPAPPAAASLELEASAAPAAPLTPAPRLAPRPTRQGSAAVGSALAEAARAEYHYVGRDLRNMAVLVVIIAVLLAAAVFAFHATGIVAG